MPAFRWLILFVCLRGTMSLAEPTASLSLSEIGRLVLATGLVDYPIEQHKFREAIGIPEHMKSSISTDDRNGRGAYLLWHLAERADGDSYEMRAYYSRDTMETTGRYPLIIGAEIAYFGSRVGYFVADPNQYPLRRAERLKPLLRASGLSVAEFTSPEVLQKYWKQVVEKEGAGFLKADARVRALVEEIQAWKKEKNVEAAVKGMEEFIARWQPVGKSVQELHLLLGKPDYQTRDLVMYGFENGFSGVKWEFSVAGDRITAFKKDGIN